MALIDELKKRDAQAKRGGFYEDANRSLAGAISRNVLPVTQNALNTAAQEAEKRANAGDYAGAAGRAVRGAFETAGSIPLDAYEYARRGVAAAAPVAGAIASGAGSFVRGLSGEAQGQGVIPQAQAAPAAPQATAAQPAVPAAPPVSDAYPDESRRAASAPPRGISPLSAQATRTSATGVPGVQRIDNVSGLRSPLFTNAEPGQAIGQMQRGGTVSSLEGGDAQTGLARMARANETRGEMTGIRDSMNFNAGGALSRQKTDEEIRRDLLVSGNESSQRAGLGLVESARSAEAERADRQQAGVIADRDYAQRESARKDGEGMRQVQEETARIALDQAKQERELLQQLQEAPEGRRAGLIQRINALRGKEATEDQRQKAVIELTKAYSSSSVPPVDESGKPMSLESFVSKGLQLAAAPGAGPQQMSAEQAMAAAQQAIARGAPLEAVNARLRQNGFSEIKG